MLDDGTVPPAPLRSDSLDLCGRVALVLAVFVVAGCVGWLYETAIGLVERGTADWDHGGLGIPFLQIYAFGAVLIELVFGGREFWRTRPVACFFAICTLTAVLEYAAGAAMLYGLGVQTWDYRVPGWDFLCTPDGLLCLRGVLSFAVMGMLLLYPLDTGLNRLRVRFPRAFDTAAFGLTALVVVAMAAAYAFGGTGAFK